MTPNIEHTEVATNWKRAVEKIWKRQRVMLWMMAPGLALIALGIILAWICIMVEGSLLLATCALVSSLVGIALFYLAQVGNYFIEWWFCINIGQWRKSAPKNLRRGILLYFIGLLISIILTLVSHISSYLYLIPIPYLYVIIVTIVNTILSISGILAIAATVLQLVGLFKMQNNMDMPTNVRKGATSILTHYAIKYGAMIIGGIFISVAITWLMVSAWWSTTFGQIENIYDTFTAAIDIVESVDSGEKNALTGVHDFMYGEYESGTDDTVDTLVTVFILCLAGISIFAFGYITAMFFRFRGWRLISQSELEITPKATVYDNVNDICIAEVVEEESTEVVSQQDGDTII